MRISTIGKRCCVKSISGGVRYRRYANLGVLGGNLKRVDAEGWNFVARKAARLGRLPLWLRFWAVQPGRLRSRRGRCIINAEELQCRVSFETRDHTSAIVVRKTEAVQRAEGAREIGRKDWRGKEGERG